MVLLLILIIVGGLIFLSDHERDRAARHLNQERFVKTARARRDAAGRRSKTSDNPVLRDWLVQRGWQGSARHCEGVLKYPRGSIVAAAELREGCVEMYFKRPPQWLLAHPEHGTCFQERENAWFLLHQTQPFSSVPHAILGAESFLKECYRSRRKRA